MKSKSFLFFILFQIFFNSATIFCVDKLSFGLKGGFGFQKLVDLGEEYDILPTSYSYPAGYELCIFVENTISQRFSIVNEFSFKIDNAILTNSTNYEGLLERKLKTQSINLPIFLKYKAQELWNIHFYIGPSFNYLLNCLIEYKDYFYGYEGKINLTNEISKLSTTLEFGFGKELELLYPNIILELKAQVGLTKFKPKLIDFGEIRRWRSIGLEFLVGFKF
jgi:hypothetical protein